MSIFIRFSLISCQVLLTNDQALCSFSSGVIDSYLLFVGSSIWLMDLVRFMSVSFIFPDIFGFVPIFVGFLSISADFGDCFSNLVISMDFDNFRTLSNCNLFLL